MDLANTFSVILLLVLLPVSGVKSASVTLSTSSEKGQLGNYSISLFCNYTLSSGERFLLMNLFRKRAMEATLIKIISFFEDNVDNATYYNEASDLKGRTVLTNPLASKRSAMLQFDSIQCADEADYRCELQYTQSGQQTATSSDSKLVVTATPKFVNQSIPYTASANLAENQNVIFTCTGNVGREPLGIFSWYKYVGGQSPGMVITNGINPVSLNSVSGSCTYVRTERLTLNLTKEDNQMVIRCTIQQTTMTEVGDGYIQTDPISVNYAPRINRVGSDPDLPTYSEGLALLMLTCNSDSNPPSNYIWTLPDGTVQNGYRLRLTYLTTNHTGRYSCIAYTSWGGQNYTANSSIKITVVKTTSSHPISTTTTTLSSASPPVTKNPETSTNIVTTAQQTANREKESISSTLFAILFGVVLGVSVVLVTILSICLHKQRMLASDLKHQLQNRFNTYDGLRMNVTTSDPYSALNVVLSDDYHQSSASLNLYERLHRQLENSEPYDILEGRL